MKINSWDKRKISIPNWSVKLETVIKFETLAEHLGCGGSALIQEAMEDIIWKKENETNTIVDVSISGLIG